MYARAHTCACVRVYLCVRERVHVCVCVHTFVYDVCIICVYVYAR